MREGTYSLTYNSTAFWSVLPPTFWAAAERGRQPCLFKSLPMPESSVVDGSSFAWQQINLMNHQFQLWYAFLTKLWLLLWTGGQWPNLLLENESCAVVKIQCICYCKSHDFKSTIPKQISVSEQNDSLQVHNPHNPSLGSFANQFRLDHGRGLWLDFIIWIESG